VSEPSFVQERGSGVKHTGILEASGTALALQSSAESTSIAVKMSGNADMDGIPVLEAFLLTLHRDAVATSTHHVDVDIRELYFMNSSCLKALVTWITKVQALPAAARYEIHFASNPSLSWQHRSLTALRCVALELVKFTE
jgi:hypothetical protein